MASHDSVAAILPFDPNRRVGSSTVEIGARRPIEDELIPLANIHGDHVRSLPMFQLACHGVRLRSWPLRRRPRGIDCDHVCYKLPPSQQDVRT